MSTEKTTKLFRGTDFTTHPNVLRVFRRHTAATWIAKFQEELWMELGGRVTFSSQTNTDKWTVLGGGEMGYVLARDGLLDDFDVADAHERITTVLGDSLHQEVNVSAGRVATRRVKGALQLAVLLDDEQLSDDRIRATNEVDRMTGISLAWRRNYTPSIGIAQVRLDENETAADINLDQVAAIGAGIIPDSITLSPIEFRRNDIET